MKRWVAILGTAVLLVSLLAPKASFTEDRETVLLARAIYAMGREESYDTKLALGTLAMNRVANPWFGGSLTAVLTAQHQFPIGSRYDADSLSAAHAVLSGRRTLSADDLYCQSADASEPWDETPVETVGGYRFYAEDGGC